MSDRDGAKELFMKYEGSFTYMESEGAYDRFKEYGVSLAQMREWEDEREAILLGNLDVEEDPLKAFDLASALLNSMLDWDAYGHLPQLLDIIERDSMTLYSFNKVILCELLMRLISKIGRHYPRRVRPKAHAKSFINATVNVAVPMLREVVASPEISVADRDLRYVPASEDVRKRAEKCLVGFRALGHLR